MQRSELGDPKASILKPETSLSRPLFQQESKGQARKGLEMRKWNKVTKNLYKMDSDGFEASKTKT